MTGHPQSPSTTAKLLPCPFCDGEAISDEGPTGAAIACMNLKCLADVVVGGNDLEDAAKHWNTRATPPQAALQPFVTFAKHAVNSDGWTGSVQNERIVDWFGPSDFRNLSLPAWLPIESAPKDGTEVLLCAYEPSLLEINDDYAGSVTGGYFSSRRQHWIDYLGERMAPTHWKPLDAPPITANSRGSAEQ